jgi:UDP-glucose 4-epimerase
VVARFIAQALAEQRITIHGDGMQSRCFTFVADAVRATVLSGSHSAAPGRVFNIGNPREVSMLRLAELIVELSGSRSRIELVPYEVAYPAGFQDTRRRVPDVSRARDLLGFTADVPLERGLEETLEWCRKNYPS